MKREHSLLRLFNTTALSFLLVACTTTRQVYLRNDGRAINVIEGEKVEVVMIGGETHRFRVTQVDERGLSGSDGSFAYRDMHSVSVIEHTGRSKNIWWLILAIAAVAALAEPDDGGSGPFCLYASDDPNRRCL